MFFVYALFRTMMTYQKYYNADLPLDYPTRRRLVLTYAHLSEGQRNDPWLTDAEKMAFRYFPELNKSDKQLAVSVAILVAAVAICGLAIKLLGV